MPNREFSLLRLYAWSSLDFGAGVIEPHNIKEMRIFWPGTAKSIWKVKM